MKPAIAIVGMACRYPDARSPGELWQNVLARRRAFRRIPDERLRLEDYYSPDPKAPDRTYATQAALIEDYEFDRVRFRVVGSTFRAADMAHWLALEIAAAALADAGFADGVGLPRDATGVLLGNTLTGEFSRANVMRLRWPYVRRVLEAALSEKGWGQDDRRTFLTELEKRYKQPFPPIGEETLAGGLSNTIAGRICNQFDLKGGGYTVDGACASSLLAIINACSSLTTGDMDVALSGGVDLSLDPFELVGFAKTSALAREQMRVYDLRSAGFWPGEGCGMLVLMRKADAIAQKRRIYAVIRGWGVSSDGSGGITRPEEDGQILALQRAYRRAGFGAETIGYFEGHGTGTEVGDATELRVLSRIRREAAPGLPPVALGTIKANIGHCKAAAGVAGFIKATMAVHHQVLPPTTGCDTPHTELSGDAPALRVLDRGEPWPADMGLRAGVSAMGFGGINTHIVLEGVTRRRRKTLDAKTDALWRSAQDAELFLLWGADAAALRGLVDRLSAVAAGVSQGELSDLAASLKVPGEGRGRRAAIVASTPGELAERLTTLTQWLAEETPKRQDAKTPKGVGDRSALSPQSAVLSPQQTTGETPVPQEPPTLVGGCAPIAVPREPGLHRLDVRAGVFLGSADGRAAGEPRIGFLFPGQGSPAHLDGGALRRRFRSVDALYAKADLPTGADGVATEVAQPAIVTASMAVMGVLEALGVRASVAVGHSLGELTALCWGGAYDRDALLRIARARGQAMAELGSPTGSMAAFRAGRPQVEQLLDGETVVIANVNSPRQTVVSGEAQAVEAVMARGKARGLGGVRLPVSHAFHSSLVEAVVPVLRAHLDKEAFCPMQGAVVSTVTGVRLEADVDVAALLCRQVISPVRFMEAAGQAVEGLDLLIEVGPGEVLSRLVGDFVDVPVVAVDAGGRSLAGLLRAVGAAYAVGAAVKSEALFDGRFTKPFDLDHRPSFLVNPCERAPVSETGWRYEDSDATEDEGGSQGAGASAGRMASVTPGTPPLEVVRQLVAERAELPVSAVLDDNRMLADLHLNSIAVGQLVAEAARLLGLAPPVTPTDYADATVAGVAQAFDDLVRTGGVRATDDEHRPPAGVEAWIRAFTVELVDLPLPRRAPTLQEVSEPPTDKLQRHAKTPERQDAKRSRELPSPQSSVLGSSSWRVFAPADYPLKEAIQAAFTQSGAGGGTVLCLPVEPGEQHVGLMLEAARAVMAEDAQPRLVVVQHGGGAAAFARALHLERQDITTCVVDVPIDHPRAAEWVVAEAMIDKGYAEVHYDTAGRARSPRLRLLEEKRQNAKTPKRQNAEMGKSRKVEKSKSQEVWGTAQHSADHRRDAGATRAGATRAGLTRADERGAVPGALGPEDVLLVTGGGRGIAAECGLALARESGARLALMGRSQPAANEELARNLERMAAAGVRFCYVSADVTDPEQVQEAVRRAEAELGQISAVLHGAGNNVPQLLRTLDEAAFLDTLRPKLQGVGNVLAAIDADRLRLLVTFGSIIARAGMQGEAHYAVANDWLGRLVDRWQEGHPHCRCLTLEWSVWAGVGMGERLGRVDALMQQGITPIPMDEGIRQMHYLLGRRTPSTRVVVTGRFGDPPTLQMETPRLPLLRFIEKTRVHYPGVELVIDVELSPKDDPYLEDHVFAGERLFPAVMGLEAMAQAAMSLAGSKRPPVFENVKFSRPVVVPDGEAQTIRLAALVRSPDVVDVVLRSRQTGFQVDHFSARCIFNEDKNSPSGKDETRSSVGATGGLSASGSKWPDALAVDPQRDLYGGILFHSGRFRRLRGYRRLMATECHAEITPGEGGVWFDRFLPSELVLGDPGARDAAIHAIQPCIPHARILPIAVDRLEPVLAQTSGPRFVLARERGREGDTFVYDVEVVRADGTVCERWHGLHLRVVEGTRSDAPWIEPLLGPYIERRAGELVPGADLRVFVERSTETDRRRRSDRAIGQALGTTESVSRRPDGKPDEAAGGLAVSTSHSADLTLAVAGPGRVGCDVEPVSSRPAEVWRDMLGGERFALAEVVAREAGEDQDTAATRVWTACECLKKAGASLDAPLVLASSDVDGWVVLSSGSLAVASFVAHVRGRQQRLAFAVLSAKDRGLRTEEEVLSVEC